MPRLLGADRKPARSSVLVCLTDSKQVSPADTVTVPLIYAPLVREWEEWLEQPAGAVRSPAAPAVHRAAEGA